MISSEYFQIKEFTTTLSGRTISYFSKPGLADWEHVSATTGLFINRLALSSNSRVLILGCRQGVLTVALAHLYPRVEYVLLDTSTLALDLAQRTLAENGIQNAIIKSEISVLPSETGCFDTVLIDLPKGRKLAQRWLAEAYLALKPDGQLYLAGANRQGIQSAIHDAEALFGFSQLLGYKKGHRIARFIKQGGQDSLPGWFFEAGIAPGTWHEFEVDLKQVRRKLCSLPGVFSYDRVDAGTELLLENLVIPIGSKVLDLGCGYGIIGLTAAISGADWVDLADVNLLSVASARQNIEHLGLYNARAIPSDAIQALLDQRYDLIVTNPPFHTGREVDLQITQAFISQSHSVLKPEGRLVLVANKFLRYQAHIEYIFNNLNILAETGKYQVLSAVKA